MTEILPACCIQGAMEDAGKCLDGWIPVLTLNSKTAKIVLFRSPDPERRKQIHFHSICCGTTKSGVWTLESFSVKDEILFHKGNTNTAVQRFDEITQIKEFAKKLISEFQKDSLLERSFYIEQAKKDNCSDYFFSQ